MTVPWKIHIFIVKMINTRWLSLILWSGWLLVHLPGCGPAGLIPGGESTSKLSVIDSGWQKKELSPGILWQHAAFDSLFGARQYLNLLVMHADTAAARFRIEAADRLPAAEPEKNASTSEIPTPGGRLTATQFAGHFKSIAVINAGFFTSHPEYVNSGIFKWRGEVYPFFKKEKSEELGFIGSSAIGLDREGNWLFFNRQGDSWDADWPEAETALAGAHRLLEEGLIAEPVGSGVYRTALEERHAGLRHPRTAICLTRDHNILLLVADGRHEEAAGLSLSELAQVLQQLGCVDAVNLDGGGSSTMYLSGHGVVNHPSGNQVFDSGGERAIRTAIIIKDR